MEIMDDKVVSDLRQVCDAPVSSTNKTDHHDVTEIFKVSLKTNNPSIYQVDINRHNEQVFRTTKIDITCMLKSSLLWCNSI